MMPRGSGHMRGCCCQLRGRAGFEGEHQKFYSGCVKFETPTRYAGGGV